MKFSEHKYDNFIDFKKVLDSVFNNTEFVQSLPENCTEYSLRVYKNKGDLRAALKDRFNKNKEPYITLSGSLFNGSDEVVVLFLSDIIHEDNDKVCLGGVFSC